MFVIPFLLNQMPTQTVHSIKSIHTGREGISLRGPSHMILMSDFKCTPLQIKKKYLQLDTPQGMGSGLLYSLAVSIHAELSTK